MESAALAALQKWALEPYAYSVLEPHHPVRPALKPAHMNATARHMAIRSELKPLVKAWRQAGIEVLLFKGFYLAEFVYEVPGQRSYNDVDILMAPECSREASLIAQSLGWSERWHVSHPPDLHSVHDHRYCGHELLQLRHDRLDVQLDVHQRILHNLNNRIPYFKQQERITRLALSAAGRRAWADTEILELAPADSILIGLVLNRAWSGDDWLLRPHDYIDFQRLADSSGLLLGELRRRAAELGCARTLELFLKRCNPYLGHLDLRTPGFFRRHANAVRMLPERGHRRFVDSLFSAADRPGEAVEVARALPTAARVVKRLGKGESVDTVAATHLRCVEEPTTLSHHEWRGVKRGVRRALRLLMVPTHLRDPALVVAAHGILWQRGCPVELRCRDGAIWLEHDGRALDIVVAAPERSRWGLPLTR